MNEEIFEQPGQEVEFTDFVVERQLTDKQIDEATDPRVLAERIPGFAESMEGVKDVRVYNAGDMAKVTNEEVDGWLHVGSLHPAVMAALYQFYTPEELTADGCKVLKKYLARNKEYTVYEGNL